MIDVEVEDPAWTRAEPDAAGLAREAAMLAAGERSEGAVLSILLTDDATMADLNRRFRGQDLATNVLAFPASRAAWLGDIALAFGVCQGEARSQDKSLADHLRHLVIHGVLHLIGHDHAASKGASRMEAVEIELLARLGVANPYVEHARRR